MGTITKIFKPRRGLNSTMTGAKANTVLASGEMFFEVQGTTVGQSKCKVKMGDGTTAYSSLPYALGDTSSDPITFTANSATTADSALASAASGATLATIVAAMKRAISLNTTAITKLNDDSNKLITISVPTSGWSSSAPYTQTIVSEDTNATDNPIVAPHISASNTSAEEKEIKKMFSYLSIVETNNGSVTLTCKGTKPTSTFSIDLKGV
jgi:hypothetical protein